MSASHASTGSPRGRLRDVVPNVHLGTWAPGPKNGITDVPGVLARITALVAEAGANIEEVHHQRAFTVLAAQNVEIELVLQTRGKAHIQQVLDLLRAAQMEAELR